MYDPSNHGKAQAPIQFPGMTPIEGRGLLRGGILLVVLSVLRMGMDHPGTPDPGPLEGETDLPELLEESRAARDGAARRSSPLGPGETLDPNRSGEEELDRLPGIGPATARALVADRGERGGFTRPEDLLRVKGIGPATLAKIRPFLEFSRGVPRELSGSRQVRRGLSPDGGSGAGEISPRLAGPAESAPARVDLNRAGSKELQSLPGVGPALAQRILDSRQREGSFKSPEDLLRVRGIGPATLARIRDRILPAG